LDAGGEREGAVVRTCMEMCVEASCAPSCQASGLLPRSHSSSLSMFTITRFSPASVRNASSSFRLSTVCVVKAPSPSSEWGAGARRGREREG
jgi:hypothetical protein